LSFHSFSCESAVSETRHGGRGNQEGPRHAGPNSLQTRNLRQSYLEPPPLAESRITGAPLEDVFGKKGEANNGMFKTSFGGPVKMHGITANDAMGVNTWAGFAETDNQAVVDGDLLYWRTSVSANFATPVLARYFFPPRTTVATSRRGEQSHQEPV
jgi:hypothetical protein